MMEWDDNTWAPGLSNTTNDGQLPSINLPGGGFDDIELQYQAYDHGIICEDFPNGLPYDASVEDWKTLVTEGLFTKLLSDTTKRGISQVRHRVRAKTMLKIKKEKKMEDGRRTGKGIGRGSSSRKELGRTKGGSTSHNSSNKGGGGSSSSSSSSSASSSANSSQNNSSSNLKDQNVQSYQHQSQTKGEPSTESGLRSSSLKQVK
ncbi:uncharacterized protein SAPINGB_P006027 [Magnusiomyces paraingens]|uniref:Uncharacterized protein n=1 Tax=Magnusiomyces paraingens TaxID=2606893 RepID=A0A5E8C4W8_9ASCO|nr:uncharacterized protein SAPINGB_P006027 [Saprochaete ingens]VVT58080.1 unnamed protein product [Saprochaete ingens]